MYTLSRTPTMLKSAAAGFIVVLAACADPVSPRFGADGITPRFADGLNPSPGTLQETFGTGINVVAGRDQRVTVCEGSLVSCIAVGDPAWVLDKNVRWAYPIGTPGTITASAGAQTRWVGPDPNAEQTFSEEIGDDVYRTTFNLPVGATNPVLNMLLYADNRASVFVNGVQIGTQPTGGTLDGDHYPNYGCTYLEVSTVCHPGGPSDPQHNALNNPFWGPPSPYTTTGNVPPVVWLPGTNTITIVVHNAIFKQTCAQVPNSPNCQSASALDFLAKLYYTPAVLGNQGCSHGFWKNKGFKSGLWTENPDALLSTVFTFPAAYTAAGNRTLYQAVTDGGGGITNLMRQAVAGLNNAGNVEYPLTRAQIISQVNAAMVSGASAVSALGTTLDGYNNLHGASICRN